MSTAGLPTEHLTQQELSEKDKGILAGLESWLCHAVFDARSSTCTDSSLGEKFALLREMDLAKSFARPIYQIRRVPAGSPPKPLNPKGPPNAKAPHSMTPMRIIEGSPTVSGYTPEQGKKVLPLAIGWTTYITEEIEVAPAVDILFITSQPGQSSTSTG